MGNSIKRFLALMLALVMVIGMMPTNVAFAEETEACEHGIVGECDQCNEAEQTPPSEDEEEPAPSEDEEESAPSEEEEDPDAGLDAAAEGGEETPAEGYKLTIYNADGTVGMEIDGTKSASDFSIKSAIEDARVFVDNAFMLGITTPATYVIEMYEDSTEDESFEIGSDVTINGNGYKIVCAEGVEVTNNGTLNDATIEMPTPSEPEKTYVAQIGDQGFETLQAAIAAAKAGDTITLLSDVTLTEKLTLPAGITLNGNSKFIDGEVWAAGNLTFVGYTKVKTFNAGYNKPIITIGAGACLEQTGGRMVIGHGATFNITGTITDAKNADKAAQTPSLIAPGASFTGAGLNFNVINAYLKFTSDCTSKNNNANGTFNFNVTNSIWDQAKGKLAFSVPDGKDPTVNFNLKDSVLTTASHLTFAVSKGEIVIDNSDVNVGSYKQLENRSTLTIKNGSVVYASVQTSQNAQNPGTVIVENATYLTTGEFSGVDLGTGKLILKNGANATVSKFGNAEVHMEPGATLTCPVADLDIITDDANEVVYENGVYAVKSYVAEANGTKYETLAEAIAVGGEVKLLSDLVIDSETYTIADGKPVTLNMNGKKLTVTDNKTTNYELFYIYGEMTVIGNGTIELTATNDRDWNAMSAIFHNRGGVLTIENGTFTHMGGTDMAYVVDNSGNYYGDATTNINDGTLSSSYIAIRNRMEQNSHGASGKAILNIAGGIISGTSRAVWAQASSTSETSPATGEINVSGGNIGLIDTPRSTGAESMTTITGGTVAAFKGEVGELTVKGGTVDEVTILSASGEAVNAAPNEDGVYEEVMVAKIADGTTYATLLEAYTAATSGTITLLADIELTETLVLDQNKSVTIALNGYDIIGNFDAPLIEINSNNKTISITGNDKSVMKNKGDVLYVVAGTFNVYAKPQIISETGNCIYIRGGKTQIQHATLTANGEYPAIQGNGMYAGNLTISGTAKVTAPKTDIAIYWPQNGILTIKNGTIEGDTAVYAKSGNIVISGGTFFSTGDAKAYEPYGNGAHATGDAVVIETSTDPNYETPKVSISGGSFTSVNAQPIAVYGAGTKVEHFVTGGTFNKKLDDKLVPEGQTAALGADGMWVLADGVVYIERNGEKNYYASLSDAITSVPKNATATTTTITLLTDLQIKHIMAGHQYAQNITVDLNRHTLSSTDKTMTAYRAGTTLTIQNGTVSGNTTGGTLVCSYGGKLILGENLTVRAGGQATVINVADGSVQIASKAGVTLAGGKIKYTVAKGTFGAAACIGDVYYATLEDALAISDTVKLASNNVTETVSKLATIEKNGFTANITAGEGFKVVETDTAYTINEFSGVAEVNGEAYETLAEAIAAANAGDEVKLLENVTLADILVINKAITLNGDGKTLDSTAARAINVDTEGNVVIKNLTVTCTGERGINVINKPANLTIENVNVTAANYAVNVAASGAGAKIAIKDTELAGLNTVNVAATNVEITIYGGKITSDDKLQFEGYGALTLNPVAEGSVITVRGVEIVVTGNSSVALNNTATGKIIFADGDYDVKRTVAYISYGDYQYTFSSLEDAIAKAQDGEIVTLICDIERATTLKIEKSVIIDGNGKTLTYTGSDRAIDVPSTATNVNLTIKNLTVDFTSSYCQRGINYNTNGALVLENVTVNGENVTYALNLPGSSDNAQVTVNGGSYTGHIALNVWGANSIIKVNDAVLTSVDDTAAENYVAVMLNNDGTTAAEGTIITITGGEIIALDENNAPSAAASNATASGKIIIRDTTKVNGKVTKTVAAVTYKGQTDFYGCETLQAAIDQAANDPNATVKLMSDIALENTVLEINGDVTIDFNGHTVTGTFTQTTTAFVHIKSGNVTLMGEGGLKAEKTNGNLSNLIRVESAASLVIESGNYYQDASVNGAGMIDSRGDEIITIEGGTFVLGNVGKLGNGSPWVLNTSGQNTKNIIVNGGSFNADVFRQHYPFEVQSPENIALSKDENGMYNVVPAVAYVTERYFSGKWYTKNVGYATLAEAIASCEGPKTTSKYTSEQEVVVLLTDIELSSTVTIKAGQSVVLDLAGKTIAGTDNNTAGNFYLIDNSKGNLTITDSVGGGKITLKATNQRNWSASSVVVANNLGTVTVKGGTIEHLGGTAMAYGIDNLTNGNDTLATLNIEGGKIASTYFAIRQFANSGTNNLNISGGEVAYAWMQSPNANANVANISVTGGEVSGICLTGGNAVVSLETAPNTTGKVYGTMPVGTILQGSTAEGFSLKLGAAVVGNVAYLTLAEAFAAAQDGDTVKLLSDAEISAKITITKSITIDGNGKTLTYTGSDRAIDVPSTATNVNLTIKNLTVDCTGSYCQRGINYNTKGNLVLENVTVKGSNLSYALNLPGSSDNAQVTVNGGSYTGHIALNVWGANSIIKVNDAVLTSVDDTAAENYVAVKLNNDGTTAAEGTIIKITGGSITALDENGEASVAASNTTATGEINISDSTVVIGAIANPVAAVTYKGQTDFYSCYTLQAAIDQAANDPNATVKLLSNIELTATVLEINGDVTIDFNGHTVTGNFFVETNKEAYNGSLETAVTAFVHVKNGNVVLKGNGGLTAFVGKYGNLSNLIRVEADAKLTIESGNYTQNLSVIGAGMIDSRSDKNVTINGGNFHLGNVGTRSNGSPWILNTSGKNTNSIIVNGGTFNADVNHQHWAFEVEMPGKATQANGDGTWTVVDAVAYVTEKSGGYDREVGYATLEDAFAAAGTKYDVTLLEGAEVTEIVIPAAFGGKLNLPTCNLTSIVNNSATAEIVINGNVVVENENGSALTGEYITLTGEGNLTAIANGDHAYGIGGGETKSINIQNVHILYVKGGHVQPLFVNDTKYGKSEPEGGAAIGSGYNGAVITLTNVTIDNAQGGSKAAGIGASYHTGVTIKITGCTIVNVEGGNASAGIGGSRVSNGASEQGTTINILNSTITAKGGQAGAGIGSGYDTHCQAQQPLCTISIEGSTINATGGKYAAGVGTGYHNAALAGVIKSSTVNAVSCDKFYKDGYTQAQDIGFGVVDPAREGVQLATSYLHFEVADGAMQDLNGNYYISNANGLKWVADTVNNTTPYTPSIFDNATVYLTADIDLSGMEWIPIGDDRSQRTEFHGTFDGQGHTISNVTITKKTDRDDGGKSSYGLFGNLKGTVKNLTVKNVSISGAPKFIGALVGRMNDGLIENCHVVDSNVTCNNWTIGGLVGQFNNGKISGCSVTDTTVTGYAAVGAIAGIALNSGERTIENCTVTNCTIAKNGAFGGDYDKMFGSVVGALYSGELTVNLNNCKVESTTVGGAEGQLCGYVAEGDKLYIDGTAIVAGVEDLKAALENGATDVVLAAGTYDSFPASSLKEGVTLNCEEGTVFEGNSKLNIKGATVIGATFSNPSGTAADQTINGTFVNCDFTGSNALRWCYAGDTVVFENCTISGDVYGVHFDGGATQVIFRNCTISGFNAMAGSIELAVFEGCTFVGNGKSAYNGVNMWGNTEMTDCTFVFDGSTANEWLDLAGANKTATFTGCKVVTANGEITMAEAMAMDYLSKRNDNATIIIDGFELVSSGLLKKGVEYQVFNADGLATLNTMMANKTAGRDAIVNLVADIDFSGKNWTPVDSYADSAFEIAELNGNGHTISNMTINGQAMFTRFAGSGDVVIKDITFDGATVSSTGINVSILTVQTYQNLLLDNVDVKNSSFTGAYKVAPLIATVYNESSSTITATLRNCDVKNVIVKATSYDFCTAGMVAFVYEGNNDKVVFENCTVTDVQLMAKPNGYASHAAVYVNDADTDDCFNEVEGVTVTNVTFKALN